MPEPRSIKPSPARAAMARLSLASIGAMVVALAAVASIGAMVVALAAVASSAVAQTTADAQPSPPPLIVVLDGSGSMWGKMPGGSATKLELVRAELSRHLDAGLARTSVGLVSIGARSSGSCAAVETAVPVAPDQKDAIAHALENFNPQGRGPIVLGLKTALTQLPKGRAPARILLVHDGPDNCGQNVCAFARTVSGSHPDLSVDVLSLALQGDERGQMSCLTSATRGTLVEAATEAEVVAGLEQIVSHLPRAHPITAQNSVQPPGPTPPDSDPTPSKPSSLRLIAVLADSQTPISSGLIWRISGGAGGRERIFRTAIVDEVLPRGTYQVALRSETGIREKTIDLTDGKRRSVTFEVDGALLSVSTGPEARNGIVTVATESGRAVWSGPADRAGTLLLPAETYEIIWSNGLARETSRVVLRRGATEAVTFGAQLGKLTVEAQRLTDEELAVAVVTISKDDPKIPGKRVVVARSSASQATFELGAGSYQVELAALAATSRRIVVLTPGQHVREALALDQMTLSVAASLGQGKPASTLEFRYQLWRADALQTPIAISRVAAPVFHLAPGKYRIESRIGQQNAIVQREFDIAGGGSGSLDLDLAAGEISFSLPNDEPLVNDNAYWEVTDRLGRRVWRSFARSPQLVLAADNYTVAVNIRNRRYRAKFIVVSGRQQVVPLETE